MKVTTQFQKVRILTTLSPACLTAPPSKQKNLKEWKSLENPFQSCQKPVGFFLEDAVVLVWARREEEEKEEETPTFSFR